MKILRALLVTCLLGTALAACNDSSLVAPEGPRYNGFTIGGGNRDGETTTSTASDSTSTARGGHTFGGGN